MTKTVIDCFGRSVRLTDERFSHVLEHPEMVGLVDEIVRVLQTPEHVRRSRSDPDAKLFYTFAAVTLVGGKWLCVVVKYSTDDAFMVTAYLTDRLKAGEDLWPTS